MSDYAKALTEPTLALIRQVLDLHHKSIVDALEEQVARADKLQGQVDELAMLVRRLVHCVRDHNPHSAPAQQAMNYLYRSGLNGSPIRHDDLPGFVANQQEKI
jgi:hypothetical protein